MIFFVKDSKLRYEGGEVYLYSGQNPDYWSFFEACGLIKGINSEFDSVTVKMWWKHDSGSFDEDLKPFRDDGDAIELDMFSFGNDCELEIIVN